MKLLDKRLMTEGGIVLFGQAGAAIGTLVGIRLITEVIDPATFGLVTLVLGLVNLSLGVFATPFLQVALRLYPDYKQKGNADRLRRGVTELIGIPIKATLILSPFIFLAIRHFDASYSILFIEALILLSLDVYKSYELAFCNANSMHVTHSTWTFMEAWLRPVTAFAFVLAIGDSATVVFLAYCLSSLAISFYHYMKLKNKREKSPTPPASENDEHTRKVIYKYAIPLVPLGLVNWISALGDRYLIGLLISTEAIGLYSAIYGLISRPFLILGQVVELVLRPKYNNLVSASKHHDANRLHNKWVLLVLVLALICLVFVSLFNDGIATIFLGEAYRSNNSLMPWVALGYSLLILSYIYEKTLYAHHKTGAVLKVQAVGALVSIPVATLFIHLFGMSGAAYAVPAYFSLNLILAVLASKRTAALYVKS